MMRARLVLIAAAVLTAGCGKPPTPVPDAGQAYKVGFVYIGPIGDYGWNKAHEDGRQYVENFAKDVKTSFVENAGPMGGEKAINDLYDAGHRLIFTTSYDYLAAARAATMKYPDLTALNCAGFVNGPRFGSYQSRVEEVEYLSGIVAGRMTRSNKIGVIGGLRIYEQIMHINAFTLGAQSVNPNAQVYVRWVGFWLDPAKEARGVDDLKDAGIDIIKNFADTNASIKRADELGLSSISHGSKDGCSIAPNTCLVASYYNWGPLYAKIIADVRSGAYPDGGRIDYVSNAELESSGLSPFAASVPQSVRDEVKLKKDQIAAGTFNIFQGPFTFADGGTVDAGARLTDRDLICTSQHVKGVSEFRGPTCTVKADCKNAVINFEFLDCIAGQCVAADLGGCPN